MSFNLNKFVLNIDSWCIIIENLMVIENLKMMNCPKCGHAAHTRSSFQVTESTKERYCQCQNINCGSTFVTHETVVRFIVTPGIIVNAPPHSSPNGQGHMNF